MNFWSWPVDRVGELPAEGKGQCEDAGGGVEGESAAETHGPIDDAAIGGDVFEVTDVRKEENTGIAIQQESQFEG